MKGKKENTNIPHIFSITMYMFYPFVITEQKAKAGTKTKEIWFSLKLVLNSVV